MSEEIKDIIAAASEGERKYSRPPRANRESFDGKESPRGDYKSKTAKKKICRFCAENVPVDYKTTRVLRSFVTERFKIVPGRISGTCASHQRELTIAIKRARKLALLAYTSCHRM